MILGNTFGQQNMDPALESKIDKILAKLTLEEKIGQTCQITLDAILKTNAKGQALEPLEIDAEKLNEAILKYKVGSILNVSSHTLTLNEWDMIMKTVHAPFKKKKSTIPILYGLDAIHGVNYAVGGTLFPQEIGLAATWNKALAEKFGQITAYELKVTGVPWNFSPVLDLGRQPLWSRFFETLGEDPYLASQMGTQIIKGYQGKNISDKYSALACMKHFVGYSYPLSGRDRTPAWIPENFLTEYYLPSFESAVKAGALTVMINSGELNGVPGHINHHLLTEVLKGEWGFQGFAVSDWEDFIFLETVHQVANNQVEAIAKSINAGLDMSMVPNSPMYKKYCEDFKTAMETGLIKQERLDDAVRRILRVKILLNLFEKQYEDQSNYPKFSSKEFKKEAYNSAAESITLLKNNNNLLPLSTDKKILVCGPTANSLNALNGAWTHTWQGVDTSYNTKNCNTIYQAVKKQNTNTSFSQAVNLFYEKNWEESSFTDLDDFEKKAKESDVIIICVGELPSTEKPGDIRSLNLSKEQIELVKIAKKYEKPIITVLVEGRPRIIHELVDLSDAIIQTYLPGDYGGDALADIIFGKVNPSGKLPYSYPKYDGIIEHYDHKKSEARSGKSDKFDAYDPEWDFGFGLSYTTFEYDKLELNKNSFTINDSITITVSVKNSGQQTGKEVVQLYLSDLVSSTVPNGKKLKNFEKTELKPGETKRISFVISEKDLTFVGENNEWILEKGFFQLSIGMLNTTFEYK
jgi:beta-glucosidase